MQLFSYQKIFFHCFNKGLAVLAHDDCSKLPIKKKNTKTKEEEIIKVRDDSNRFKLVPGIQNQRQQKLTIGFNMINKNNKC